MKINPIYTIRQLAANEEIDYIFLISCLQNYAAPRDIITRLLKNKDLIRVKKGIYVFGDLHRHRLISLEVLANLIYGPSYVSCEYALHYYGLIPESPKEITSMTMKRNKIFKTPLGVFSYNYLNVNEFHLGVDFIRFSDTHGALIATKEKALIDYLYVKEKTNQLNTKELLKILLDDYRIDPADLKTLDINLLQEIWKQSNSKVITLLINIIQNL